MKSATILKPLPAAIRHANRSLLVAAALVGLTLANAQATLLFSDAFDYADGSITENSGGAWIRNENGGGAASQFQVSSGRAAISRLQGEDVYRSLGAAFESGQLYYSAVFQLTEAPLAAGAYIMHFSDSDTGADTDFFARLFVAGTGTNQFKIGVKNRSTSPDYAVVFDESTILDLNTQVAIVVKLDLSSKQTTLWINPTDENSFSVTDSTSVEFVGADTTLSRFQFRQTGGIGQTLVDELRVGTTFAEVALVAIPEPSSIFLFGIGASLFAFGAFKRRRKSGLLC